MSLVEFLLAIFDIGLLIWIMNLKARLRSLDEDLAHRPPEPETLTVNDLRLLQKTLLELVQNIEGYTESQLRKMRVQTEALHTLCERLENKITDLEPPPPPVVEEPKTTRIVPLSPRQGLAHHKDKDRIIDLYKMGWTPEKIAEELRITRGEVQLIVNLS